MSSTTALDRLQTSVSDEADRRQPELLRLVLLGIGPKEPTERRLNSRPCLFSKAVEYISLIREQMKHWLEYDATYTRDGTRLESASDDQFSSMCRLIRNAQHTVWEVNEHPCGNCPGCRGGISEHLVYDDPEKLRPGYDPRRLD